LGKPASLHATTAFLASNVYAGQHPKPQHWVPTPKGKPYIGSQTGTTINGLVAKVDTMKEFGRVVGNFFTLTSNQ